MRPPFARRTRAGFGMIEALCALALLGIVTMGVVGLYARLGRATRSTVGLLTAQALARNEIALLIAGGPLAAADSFAVSESGVRSSGGPYSLAIARTVACSGGGTAVADNASASLPVPGCPATGRPTVTYTVRAYYARPKESTLGMTSYSATVGTVVPTAIAVATP